MKTIETEYVYIPKSTLIAKGISEEHALSPNEAAKIVVNRKIIAKFIRQKALDLQFSVGGGKWEGKEKLGQEVIKALSEIAIEAEGMKEKFEEYVIDRRRKEELEREVKDEKKK